MRINKVPGDGCNIPGAATNVRVDDAMDSTSVSPNSSTRVIHVHEMPDYPEAVYVGRAIPRKGLKRHPLANPTRVGTGPTDETLAVSLAMYRRRLPYFLQDGHVEDLIALRGRALACWCRRSDDPRTEDNACHADIIAEWLALYTDDELRAMAGS